MNKERSRFTPEFKLEAVSLVLDKNYTVMQACAALEIGPTALRRWIKQYKQEQQGVVPEGCRALTPEQRQIQELQKRIERLELEKDILKKATALLMTDEFKHKR
jgi:transposase